MFYYLIHLESTNPKNHTELAELCLALVGQITLVRR